MNKDLSAVSSDRSSPETTPRMMKCITAFSISSAVSPSMRRGKRITLLHCPFSSFRIMDAIYDGCTGKDCAAGTYQSSYL